MRKIFSILSIVVFAAFTSCEDYDSGVDVPSSLGFDNDTKQVAFTAETNVETIKVYATTTATVDRVFSIVQLLEGTNPDTNEPYATAEAGDYTVSSTTVTIPAGQSYGTFDVIFNPELSLAVSRYVTFKVETPGDYAINKSTNRIKVSYNRLCFSNTIVYDLVLDAYGSEITWNIKNSSGDIVQSGGPYSDAATNVLQPQAPMTFTLPDGTYTYTINDSYGDGMISGTAVIGSYKISKDCGSVLINALGNGFTTTRSHTFSLP